ncbi:DUF6745 domain-containing protein [Deinococcus cellulosilyticus]|uniref:DUF6745 domain-containing protein n=1 Tax=Deinococcus cellulosilyticus (strain DSM 18568 / NBRC 106333 / KACC 11606 / 5516J-15) TaxID=1223518 RepID=A0A511N4U5_DEIC1|nr:hypothetical protein [Deinococcus cellulosilyticus]GEM47497.1 hypothetical protein DC3_31320 [Deinococcus cellulosilyticus NBRC 106333 = KACC 11606]
MGISAAEAKRLILSGQAPEHLVVQGVLEFQGEKQLRSLPAFLTCDTLDVRECPNLHRLPDGLSAGTVLAGYTHLQSVPDTIKVKFKLDLEGCTSLISLPESLKVGSLILRDCVSLRQLPEGLDVYFLDVSGCSALEHLPEQARVQGGHVVLRGCTRLKSLPSWLNRVARLDLRGCEHLHTLPETLKVSGWIDLADSGITSLPHHGQVPLRWKGVPIEPRIAFDPASITGQEILETDNAELRRVKLERMGYENFLAEVDAQILDQDQDAGGPRKLLKVPLPDDEDLVALWVICPSTDRNYVIRVPPKMKTAHQAAAWIAGFDDPKLYQPVMET